MKTTTNAPSVLSTWTGGWAWQCTLVCCGAIQTECKHGYHFHGENATIYNWLFRYQSLWIPLLEAATRKGVDISRLVPPLDIAWVWHVSVQAHITCTTVQQGLMQAGLQSTYDA